jgi:transcription antitermination protein NusB
MLSRRSVRVKVMQLLYQLNRDESVSFPEMVERYKNGINTTFETYIHQLWYVLKVAEFAFEDEKRRSVKHVPGPQDIAFKPYLADNICTRSLSEHKSLLAFANEYTVNDGYDLDQVRTLYNEFMTEPAYEAYLAKSSHTNEEHIAMLLELYRFLMTKDLFIGYTSDRYMSWEDDESLVIGAIKRTLKALPAGPEFYKEFQPNDETVKEFGEGLLRKVCQEDAVLYDQIVPNLENWEPDRVALLDMIMLKMALSELLHFPTIPTKVTLNEYVEISKTYSTDKSKEFINGILDKLLKSLTESGAIVKEGRGLIE